MSDLKVDGIVASTDTNTALTLQGKGSGKVAIGDGALLFPDADGSAGEFIKTDGSAALSFSAAGGAWNLIETGVASSSASITLNPISTTYDTYVVMGSDLVPATDDVEPWFRIGDSSGIDSGAGNYSWFNQGKNMDSVSSHKWSYSEAAAEILLSEDGTELTGNASGEGFGFTLWLHNPSDSTMWPSVSYVSTMIGSSSSMHGGWMGGGHREAVLTITQVQFLFESGNIATGRCSLYGIAHA